MNRRQFIKTTAATAAAAPFFNILVPKARSATSAQNMNLVLFVTDQQRSTQNFPAGWDAANMPGLNSLRKNGASFTRAFCTTCQCSPSRVSLFTGLFPAQNGCTQTLSQGSPPSSISASQLYMPYSVPNLAMLMSSMGYDVVYKGKWHMSKALTDPNDYADTAADIASFGFFGWDPPDAGQGDLLSEYGGGNADNDYRFITGIDTSGVHSQQGALLGFAATLGCFFRPGWRRVFNIDKYV